MITLEGEVVLISGGSDGLGLALAVGFARLGARVSICARGEKALNAARTAVLQVGGECVATVADVSDAEMVDRWVADTVARFGNPTVLINNASVLGPRVELIDYPVANWKNVLDVNLTGAFLVSRSVIPHMLANGHGSIINVSSGAAVPPRVRWGAYAIAKTALDAFTLNLAEELRGTGIRVNAVDPGAMRTDMRSAAYPDEDPLSLVTPDANVPVFAWLASSESEELNGERIVAAEWLRDRQATGERHRSV